MNNILSQLYFETASRCVAQAGLGLLAFLPQPSEFGMTGMPDQVQLPEFLMLSSLRNGTLKDTNFYCFDS